MILIRDDDRCLQVAERLDLFERCGVFAEVDDVVLDSLSIERAVCRDALYA